MLSILRLSQRTIGRRSLATTSALRAGFDRPAPPALNRNEQKDFEELLRRVNAPASQPLNGNSEMAMDDSEREEVMHPDFRSKPKAAFEGETNPDTGEIGGPKHEPLAHGSHSDRD